MVHFDGCARKRIPQQQQRNNTNNTNNTNNINRNKKQYILSVFLETMTLSSDDDEEEEVTGIVYGTGDGDDDDDDDDENDNDDELERIQTECSAMVRLLKKLEREEHDLQCQLEILAREAILCGFAPNVIEPHAPKRRRTAGGAGAAGAGTPAGAAGKKKDET